LGVFTGRLSFRRLKIILDHLPPESAFRTAIRDRTPPEQLVAAGEVEEGEQAAGHGPWSQTDHLLALLFDQIGELTYVTRALKGDKKAKPPKPLPRPGVGDQGKPKPINREAVEFLARIRENRGAVVKQ